jgi:hypothetical protein
MKKFITGLTSIGFMAVPMLALAQGQTVGGILGILQSILDVVIPILITIAVIVFIVGVIQYIMAKEDTDKQKGRDRMIYGIIGLFVILAIFGIIEVIGNTLNVDIGGTQTNLPSIQ